MSACNLCCAWNLPLHRKATLVVDAGLVGLKFEEWMAYHLHVAMHQANNWGGEIEQMITELHTPKELPNG